MITNINLYVLNISDVLISYSPGTIRNLSPNLWHLTHLTSLYLNDNCLSRIPPDISRLVNLRTLDLSSNKLRSLPAELGELIYLR
jgi:CCR4-NOT transcription complex subunit 6